MTAPRGEPCTRSLRLAGRVVAAWLACVTVLVFGAREAYAHQASDGYLTLTFSAEATSVDGRWDLPVSNLERVLVLDRDSDGAVRMDRVPARREDIVALAFSHLAIRSGGAPCPLSPDDLAPTNHQGAPYVRLQFTAVCPAAPRVIDLDYTLFFDVDPSHRGLVRIEDGAASRSILFSSGFRHERFTRSLPDRPKELASAIRSGVAHIASGIDHLLFLLALLLPSVLRREDGGWKPVAAFRTALVEVAKIVTAFTLAHSITLMTDGCVNFRKFLVEGTRPNLKKINEYVERSLMLVTALSPVIGYDKAATIAHYAMDNDFTLKEAALKLGFVSEAEFDRVVDPRKMVKPYVAGSAAR